ncbi:hypothetical protein BDR06DRAFT_418646 [Suillus hirtellus]|nr:hypothetical protein BDR06DRAFT_418646 [Suillus hirtellus]
MQSLVLRSSQVLRVLNLPLSHATLDQSLSHLSVSIPDAAPERQAFSAEVIRTITHIATLHELDDTLLPRLFWTTDAVISPSSETEYIQAVRLLSAFLDRIDLDDPHIVTLIVAQRPRDWNRSIGLQQALWSGLRSATTLDETFTVLGRLAKLKCAKSLDSSQTWLRDLFNLSLPWCMHAMCTDQHDEALNDFCSSIADLADEDGLESINRTKVQEPLFADELDEDLGVLVQDLHELSESFQKTKPQTQLLPSQQLEDRVASILARSTNDINNMPQTPFGDVFQIGGSRDLSDDSTDESDPESEVDAFKYDSPAFYHSAPNGKGLY